MEANASNKPLKIVLGVCGSIACYKAADLASQLSQRGHDVHVVLTQAASELVTAATFFPLTGNPVHSALFEAERSGRAGRVGHIDLADHADIFVVAPATAHTLAKLANGIANDFLSTLLLAYRGPVLVAPAMNTRMWDHPAVQHNAELLRSFGYKLVEPACGQLACGHVGAGRLPEPAELVAAIEALAADASPTV